MRFGWLEATVEVARVTGFLFDRLIVFFIRLSSLFGICLLIFFDDLDCAVLSSYLYNSHLLGTTLMELLVFLYDCFIPNLNYIIYSINLTMLLVPSAEPAPWQAMQF